MTYSFSQVIGAATVLLLGGIVTPTGPRRPDFQGNWTNGTQTRLIFRYMF